MTKIGHNNPFLFYSDIIYTMTEVCINVLCLPNTDAVDPEPPMIVPGSMSPTSEIYSNQSLWSMSIQFDKQVYPV